ncbi:MAG: YggS family pyridoxal phosphate-dependent enzyme [Nanoarchaeota archaeon]|nr:YggS family pyridoxal phosphate-dependent enzyme [Nanoarchaeota archaeon]
MPDIKENLNKLEIDNAQLIAATKEVPIDLIKKAISYGVTDIGENYVQEAEEKFKQIGKKVRWHFIGHLQKNKVSKAVKIFDVIQSVDSYNLAKRIDAAAEKNEKIIKIMMQVNISGDKSGVEPEEVISLYKKLINLKNLEVIGLMCIAEKQKPEISFKKMRNLNSKMKLPFLSMGMSNDYKIAIENGSNMVRLGRLIFGKRASHLMEDTFEDILSTFKETIKKINTP